MTLLDEGWRFLRSLSPMTAWKLLHSAPTWILDWIAEREQRELDSPALSVEVFGRRLSNPIGIAAGLDKDGKLLKVAWSMGVGFHVIGSVLPKPHKGVKPKILLRLPDGSTINRLGLPSKGSEKTLKTIKNRKPKDMPLVISLASLTPEGYGEVYRRFIDVADWYEINVSCPNVKEHSTFEDPETIREICKYMKPMSRPALLKIPPTLDQDRILQYVDVAKECGLKGIVAANTLKISYRDFEAGLAGPKLYPIIRKVVAKIREVASDDFVIVAVGGIDSGEKALEIMELGANLIEILSAIIHKGPSVIRNIKMEMIEFSYKELF